MDNQHDLTMTDAVYIERTRSSQYTVNIEDIHSILRENMMQINDCIVRGVHDMKLEFQNQIQNSHITVSSQTLRSNDSMLGSVVRFIRPSGGSADAQEGDVEHYKEKARELRQDLKVALEERNKLRMEREQNSRKYREMQTTIETLEQKSRSTRELDLQITQIAQENQRLQEQTAKFRDIILSKSSIDSEAVDDTTISRSFAKLREQIQRIVFRFYVFEQRPRPLDALASKKQRDFFDQWRSKLSPAQLKNRARAVVFDLLAEEILCRPCFGLEDFEQRGELEHGLINFEMALGTVSNGHEDDIAEWRAKTVKCAGFLPQSESAAPGRVALVISNFMDPILAPRYQKEGREGLADYLVALCTSAYQLTLMLRGCKDVYKCETPSPGSQLIEEDAEPQDNEKSTKYKPNGPEVLFTIHGSLVKYPEHNSKERIVLEKAHVVLLK